MKLPDISEKNKELAELSKNISPILKPIFILMYRFLPKSMTKEYTSKYIDWTFLQKNREMFDKMLDELQTQFMSELQSISDNSNLLSEINTQKNLEVIEHYQNYVSVLKQAVLTTESNFLDNNTFGRAENHDDDSIFNEETSSLWYDLFQRTAMRRNEKWRNELLAKCVVLENQIPNSISIKTLWDIGMLDTITFNAFAMFLDSCIVVDGYPVMLLDESQLHVQVHDESKTFQGVLGEFINLLIDEGLIQRRSELFRYTKPLEVESCEETKLLIHGLYQDDGMIYRLELEGFMCTRFGQDIKRLYDVKFNFLSVENLKELEYMLQDSDVSLVDFN